MAAYFIKPSATAVTAITCLARFILPLKKKYNYLFLATNPLFYSQNSIKIQIKWAKIIAPARPLNGL